MSARPDSAKTIFFALGANFAIFIAKLAAAAVTGSGSLLAEAVHSLADCGNQGLLLIGMRQSRRTPSPDHPLGYGMVVYFWSFLVALVLFSMGGMFSFYEGVHKLQVPEALHFPWLAIGVLVFSMIAEWFSMWGCLREVNKASSGDSLWRWFRESRQSELIVVFGEDLAALIGLSLALIAVLATWLSGDPLYDACGSLAIGVLLCVIAVFVARRGRVAADWSECGTALAHVDRRLCGRARRSRTRIQCDYLQLGPYVMVAVPRRRCTDRCRTMN